MTTTSEDSAVLFRREMVELRGRVSLLQTRLLDKEKLDAEVEQMRKNELVAERNIKEAETAALTEVQKALVKMKDRMDLCEGRLNLMYANLESLIAWTGFRNEETTTYENFRREQIIQSKKKGRTGRAGVRVILVEDERENSWEAPDGSIASDDDESQYFQKEDIKQESSQYILPDVHDSVVPEGFAQTDENSAALFTGVTGVVPFKSLEFEKDPRTNKFHCPVCPKEFANKKDVSRHYRTHTGEKPFRCHKCPMKFIRKDQLTSHLQRKHDGEPPHPRYEKKSQESANAAVTEDSPPVSEGEMDANDSDPGSDPDYTPIVSNPVGGVIKRGRGRPRKTNLTENDIQLAERSLITDKFHCTICESQFRNRRDLIRHFRLHTGEKPFACKECGKAFSRRDKLLDHERTAHGPPKERVVRQREVKVKPAKPTEFFCDQCPQVFTNRRQATKHIARHKLIPAEKQECPTCQATFYKKDKLNHHMQHVHGVSNDDENETDGAATEGTGSSAEASVECPNSECGKKFAAKRYLDVHLIGCRGNRPFLCHECPKTFCTKSSLMQHSYSVHRGIKRYVCKDCNKGFYTSGNYKKHIRGHKNERPFKCKLCDRAFVGLSDLRSHEKIHRGIRDHQCPDCPLKFFRGYTLRRHQRVHTGEKPYQCETCGASFSQSGTLKTHKRSHNTSEVRTSKIRGTKYRVLPQADLEASNPSSLPVSDEGRSVDHTEEQDSAEVVSSANHLQVPNHPTIFNIPPLFQPVEQSQPANFESTVDFVTYFGTR